MKAEYKNETSWGDIILIFIAVIILAIVFGGCYSPKKAEKAVSKALAYYPEQTIGKVRILAPCITSGTSFSTDSAGYKASLDSLYNSRAWYESLIRGLESLPPHPIAQDTLCPELAKENVQLKQRLEWSEQYIISMTDDFNNFKPIIKNRVDTVEDLSKVMEMDFKLLAQQKLYKQQTEELLKVKQERDKAKSKNGTLIWWIVGLGISNLLLLVLLYFILKGKATTKLL